MNPQEEVTVYCPYCDEPISLLIDCSVPEQQYVEDCFVCCRPILVSMRYEHSNTDDAMSQTSADNLTIDVRREDD
jgi:hypothetical protein